MAALSLEVTEVSRWEGGDSLGKNLDCRFHERMSKTVVPVLPDLDMTVRKYDGTQVPWQGAR